LAKKEGETAMDFHVIPSRLHNSSVSVPGDKSISHRALMLGSIADGTSEISGFLAGEDCLSTLAAFRALGVKIEQPDVTRILVHGRGRDGLLPPAGSLDLGNSGTAMRLMCGVLAGQAFSCSLHGDQSLSARPMGRIIEPLAKMGARIDSAAGKPPLRIHGGQELIGIDYELPVASAQVKSCLLLAGLYAGGRTAVFEPAVTRDHTERMLRAMGVRLDSGDGWHSIEGGQSLQSARIEVPGDLSSAAFLILAALLAENAEILISNVGMNPTRTGVIAILLGMGAIISIENPREPGFELVADIRVCSSQLVGATIDPALVSLAIDEFPVLFVAAAAAQGETSFSGIGELRVKESDRIAAMSSGLRALGISVDESADGAVIHGGKFQSGTVQSFADHRIAMALAVAASIASGPVTIRDIDTVATSFPGFAPLLRQAGLQISETAAGEAA
jgi:3-phosphoshikimate 1-carboxyvinyltransferase